MTVAGLIGALKRRVNEVNGGALVAPLIGSVLTSLGKGKVVNFDSHVSLPPTPPLALSTPAAILTVYTASKSRRLLGVKVSVSLKMTVVPSILSPLALVNAKAAVAESAFTNWLNCTVMALSTRALFWDGLGAGRRTPIAGGALGARVSFGLTPNTLGAEVLNCQV